MTDEELDKGRRLARRRVAYISFFWLMAVATCIFAMLLFGDERKDVATALSTSSALLGTIIGVFTTIILAYFAASATERVMKK